MMGDGSIHECSFAQNCVRICPKKIPLTTSISHVYGRVMQQAFVDFFSQVKAAQRDKMEERNLAYTTRCQS
jgi:L-lactate utilization protein LutB